MAADAGPRPGPGPAPGRRPDPRAGRRAGRHREPRRRQADHARAAPSTSRPPPQQYEYCAALARAPRRGHPVDADPRARLHAARAGRRRRRHHAVQLPAHPVEHQDRRRPGRRQRGRAQAGRRHPAQRAVHGPAADATPACPTGCSTWSPAAARSSARRLLRHPGVDKIAFTGSTAVGRHAASVAGEHLKPVTMELGGNAAHIVFDDADLDVAIGAVIKAFVFNSGQFCMAGPRLLVARPLHDTVLGILEQAVPDGADRQPARRGDGHRPDGRRAAAAQGRGVRRARPQGGRPDRLRRRARSSSTAASTTSPTVIADLPADSRVVAEEVFGPVLTVQPFDTEDEAVALANGTPYGLAAGLQTTRRRPRAPGRGAARRRHRLGQRLGDARPGGALRRRQGLRLRP